MSHRFPLIPPNDRTPAQRVADDMLAGVIAKHPANIYKDENGCFIGPYAVLMYNPELIAPWISLARSVLQQDCLSARERELVVLAVVAVYDAPYILYAHELLAEQVGLSQEQISSGAKGQTPSDLTHPELVVYQTSLELAESRKQLSETSWARGSEVLGREKTAAVAHVVAGYVYTAILLNVGAVGAPK
ncbi:hypothetical protein ACLMJK_005501 [Lecanora helva]